MFLTPDIIGFTNPRGEFLVEFLQMVEAERVQMISRRESLDAGKARMLEAARKNKMTDKIIAPHLDRDERHAHLKSNSRLLRQHLHRTARLNDLHQRIEQFTHVLALTVEVRIQTD